MQSPSLYTNKALDKLRFGIFVGVLGLRLGFSETPGSFLLNFNFSCFVITCQDLNYYLLDFV